MEAVVSPLWHRVVGGVAPVGVARLSQTVAELGVPGVGLDVAGAEHLLSLLTVPAREFSHQCPGVPLIMTQLKIKGFWVEISFSCPMGGFRSED